MNSTGIPAPTPFEPDPLRSGSDDFVLDQELRAHLHQVSVSDDMLQRWKVGAANRATTLELASTAVSQAAVSQAAVSQPAVVQTSELNRTIIETKPQGRSLRWVMFASGLAAALLMGFGIWSSWAGTSVESVCQSMVRSLPPPDDVPFVAVSSLTKDKLASVFPQLRGAPQDEARWKDGAMQEWTIVRMVSGKKLGYLCYAKRSGIEGLASHLEIGSEPNSGPWSYARCRSEDRLVVFVHQGSLRDWLQPKA